MRAGYGKEESRKKHKAGSGKGGLNYCEIKENTGGLGIRSPGINSWVQSWVSWVEPGLPRKPS